MKTSLRKLTRAWPLAICLLLPSLTRAETPVQAWAQRYNGLANGNDWAYAMAVDGSNNVIVTGASTDSGGWRHFATIKYSSVGVPLWTNRYNGPGNGDDKACAMAVDGNNAVIVTGYSTGSGSSWDYATIKYSSEGVPLWTNRYTGELKGTDAATALAVDGSNNVVVTGYSAGNASAMDYATIKYSSAGVPLWTNRYNGPQSYLDEASAVAVDGNNDVIVTGTCYVRGGSFYDDCDYLTIKYSNGGVPLWTNRYDGPGKSSDYAQAMAVDGGNNVIVTGYSIGAGSSYDYATIKYSSAGVPLWTNRYNGPGNGEDKASAVAVDGNDAVIVTGYSTGSGSARDYATIKYSSAGVPLWTNRYNGPGDYNDAVLAVAVDGSNNVIVTGGSASMSDSPFNYDCATIKYSSTGVPLWTNRYNGSGDGDDFALAVVVDHSGNVILAGYSINSASGYDFAIIKYICVPSPVMTGLPLTNGSLQLRVEDVLQPGTLVIEASTDLAGWAPVFTNTTPTNVLFYTDPEAGNSATRYYRAFQSP